MTNKNRKYSFRTPVAKRLLKEIKESSIDEYVIVHGGGSFGHPGAEKYDLNVEEPDASAEGISSVQLDMRRMNNHVLELMHEQDMWGVSIPGGLITLFEDGKLQEINGEIVQRYLSLDVVPVTFGDVTIDKKRKVTICSGDDIVLGLSDLAERAIFVSDVDGIYKDGKLIEEFEEEMLPLTGDDLEGKKDTVDVTGGMNKKVEKMMDISDNCETQIVNGNKKDRLRKILDREPIVSTEVKR